jgi:hypothetical protein
VQCVFLRLSHGARHSRITAELDEMIGMSGTISLETDIRDASVYYFTLPKDTAQTEATRIISTLAIQPHIDEAWHGTITTKKDANFVPQPE